MRAPRLRGLEAPEGGGVELAVFWHLGSPGDLASLVGASGRVEALRQLGFDEQEVQDLIREEPYIGSTDLDPDLAASDGDDGSNPARRLAMAARNLARTMAECYACSSSSSDNGSATSLFVFAEREAFDEVQRDQGRGA